MKKIPNPFLFCLMAVLSLIAVLWFKTVCFENEWLGIQNDELGIDGVFGWFCLMVGFLHLHDWILKQFKN